LLQEGLLQEGLLQEGTCVPTPFLRSEEKYFRKIERGVLLTFEELWDRLFWYETNKQMHLLLKWYREREGI